MWKEVPIVFALLLGMPKAQSAVDTLGEIDLPQAQSLALARNPELAAFAHEAEAAEAMQGQASLRNNPEISLDVEDFAGSGNHSGLEGSQTTVQLSQRFELGGKRSARMKAAALAAKKSGWEREAKRLEILKKTSLAYFEAVCAQRGLVLAGEGVRLADQTSEAVAQRAKAGRAGAAEESKAKISSAQARIELQWAKHHLDEARENLAALWGEAEPRFQSVKDMLDNLHNPPGIDSLLAYLDQNPELARFTGEMERQQALMDMERTQAVPDLTVKGGYRRLAGTGDNAAVAGLSVPLPLLNRNQGRIQETRRKGEAAQKQREAAKIRLRLQLAEAVNVAATTHAEISLLKTSVLPDAESASKGLVQGYQLGRYSLLEALDAQKTLAAARAQYLRALLEFHNAIAGIESLIGKPLNP